MTDKRNLEREIEELADDLPDRRGDDDPPTKAEFGVTAGFVRFDDDGDLSDLPEGWEWEREEDVTNAGADLNVAVREDPDE
jgi:hypothetical protein